MVTRESWRSQEAYKGRSPEKKVSIISILFSDFFGMTGLGIEVAFEGLFLGAGEGLVRYLDVVELGEERELGIYRSQYLAAERGRGTRRTRLTRRTRRTSLTSLSRRTSLTRGNDDSDEMTIAGKDDGLGDFGEGIDEGFDIVRADVLAIGEDDDILLQTAFYIEISVLVQMAFVSGMKPAVGVNFTGGSFGVLVIAEHDVLAFDKDLASGGDAASHAGNDFATSSKFILGANRITD